MPSTTTTLTVTSSGLAVTTVATGSVVTLTATVQNSGTPITPGQVNFCDVAAPLCTDIHLLGTAQLTAAGTATIKFVPKPGNQSYKAVFSGTTSAAASASTPSALTVMPPSGSGTSSLMTASIAATGFMGGYKLMATITGSQNPAPTGTLSFVDTTNLNYVLATEPLMAGSAGLGFVNLSNPATGNGPNGVTAADFNNDGLLDLAVRDGIGNTLTILLGHGDGTFTQSSRFSTGGTDPAYAAVTDFNSDGNLDIAVTNFGSDTVKVFLGHGDGTFTLSYTGTTGNAPLGVVAADFNRDGKQDLAVVNGFGGLDVLLGDGNGTFTAITSPATGDLPIDIATADFNGDGISDLVVTSADPTSNNLTILLGNGDGTFTAAPSPLTGQWPNSVVIGDFNGDGKADLAVADFRDNAISILPGNGNGTFGAATTISGISYPYSLSLGDFNGDGKQDLIATNYYGTTVTVLTGAGDGTFTTQAPIVTENNPSFTATGDFNGDGLTDFALTTGSVDNAPIYLAGSVYATAIADNVSPVGSGTHFVKGSYAGDSQYSAIDTAIIPLDAQQIRSPLTLAVNPASSAAGQPVTLTANLTTYTAQGHAATGTITFYNGGGSLGAITVASGTAALNTSALPAGTDCLTAVYNGDANFTSSVSNTICYTVTSSSTPPAVLSEPVGNTSPSQMTTLTITTSGTIATINVLTAGITNLDYKLLSGGTCAVGAAYPAGATCTVQYSFTPAYPGVRQGGVTLTTSSGSILATSYIQGLGTAPRVNYAQGTLHQITFNNVDYPSSITPDGNGNFYVTETTSAGSSQNAVVKETWNGSGYTQSVVATGFEGPNSVAVDGAGNVFIADFEGDYVYKETPTPAGYVQTFKFSGPNSFGFPFVASVDGRGNLYLATNALGLVKETYTPGGYGQTQISAIFSWGVSLDGNGVVYNDSGSTFTPQPDGTYVTGSYPGFGRCLAVDLNGNVYCGQQFGGATIYKDVSNGSGGYTQSLVASPAGDGIAQMTVDAAGNLYFLIYNSATGDTIWELSFTDAPAYSFATTNVGSPSSDSPKTLAITNAGNAPLVFPVPGAGNNPSISPGFAVTGGTCPQLSAGAALPATLAANASCTDLLSFIPVAPGTVNGELVITDNHLNAVNATQIIPLDGTGTGVTAPPTVTAVQPNSGPQDGSTTVTITGTNFTGATVVRFGTTAATSFAVISATSISVVSPAAAAAGAVDITVTTPAGTSATNTLDRFTYIPRQTITFPATVAQYAGTSMQLHATTTSGLPVTYTLISGPATVNGSVVTFQGAGTVTLQADQGGNSSYSPASPVQQTITVNVLTEPVGITSSAVTTLVTFTAAGMLNTIGVHTQGAALLDFNAAAGGTCIVATTYAAGDTCTAAFNFTPARPGMRFGGITLVDSSGVILANSYVYGVGVGPQVLYSPPAQTLLGSGISGPSGVAVDGNGNVFASNMDINGLYEVEAGTGTVRSIGTFPLGDDVAVDGSGNVFIEYNRTSVAEVMAVNGLIPANPVIRTIATSFNYLNGLKVDGNGNVFVASGSTLGSDGAITEIFAVNGSIPASPVMRTLISNFGSMTGVAIDATGNVFFSDELNNQAYEMAAVNGVVPANTVPRPLGTGFDAPSNITVDATGNVYVSEYGGHRVREILAVNGQIPVTNQTILTLVTGNIPQGVVVDGDDNVYVADEGITQVVKFAYPSAPTLTFSTTSVGSTSSDSPRTVTISNGGNADLIFSVPVPGDPNPSITSGFTLGSGSTCLQLASGAHTGPLTPNSSCTNIVSFTPVAPGQDNGTLVMTDNNLNGTFTTQIIPLSGFGVIPPTITFSVPDHTFGDPPFAVNATSNSAGAFTYSVLSGPATIAGNIVTLTGAGTVTLRATQAANGIYTTGTQTATFLVGKASQTIHFTQPQSPVPYGSAPFALVATATSSLPVTFSVLSGPATVSGNMLTVTNLGTIVVAADQPGNVNYNAAPEVTWQINVTGVTPTLLVTAAPNPVFLLTPVTLKVVASTPTITPTGSVTFYDGTATLGTVQLSAGTASLTISTLTMGTHSITVQYGGAVGIAPAVSAAVTVTVEDFSLNLTNNTLTIPHGGTAQYEFTVSPIGGTAMPAQIDLTLAGEPDRSVITMTPQAVSAGSGVTSVTLVIKTPDYPVGPWNQTNNSAKTAITLAAITCLLLPFRRRRIALLAIVLAVCTMSLSGCGWGWRTQHFTLAVTGRSGQLTHTVNAALISRQ